MGKEVEMKEKIGTLNSEIKELNNRKNEYQRVNREISGAISDFDDMKKSISKAQGYLKEGDTSEAMSQKIAEMENDKKEVNGIIGSLEEVQRETNKEIREIDNEITDKESQIRKLNIEIERERRNNENREKQEDKK